MVHSEIKEMIGNLAQASAELEGCGSTASGSQVQYNGPEEFAPFRAQDHTPGMNLA